MNIGIIYFRRDLRIYDNTALNECIRNSDKILPIFIFNPIQIGKTNTYFSQKCFNILLLFVKQLSESLNDKLLLLLGNPAERIEKLVKEIKIHHPNSNITLYFNTDFTPFSIKRDAQIFDKLKNISIKSFVDTLLLSDEYPIINNKLQLIPDEKSLYYKKFTPFYNYYKSKHIQEPYTIKIKNYLEFKHVDEYKLIIDKDLKFSRSHAIKQINKKINYAKTHNDVFDENGTYHISHYLKFGIISIREAYYAMKHNTVVTRQLFWREFYYIIAWHNPTLLQYQITSHNNSTLNPKYNTIKWLDDSNKKIKQIIKAWKTGTTGFPIVDAGMRQLAQIGYMHNRARLIVASFLTKICGIDWRIGEQWFAQNLIDYDPIINNGNWLWVAGGGADSQPYFRVFNPWLQQKEHDPNCIYIKKWIPELDDIEPKIIHKLYDSKYHNLLVNYPTPIIDYEHEKNKTYELYAKLYK